MKDLGSSSAQSSGAAKTQRLTESATTTVGAWWRARKAGLRLPEHELPGDAR